MGFICNVKLHSTITSISESPIKEDLIYIGTEVHVTEDGLKTGEK